MQMISVFRSNGPHCVNLYFHIMTEVEHICEVLCFVTKMWWLTAYNTGLLV